MAEEQTGFIIIGLPTERFDALPPQRVMTCVGWPARPARPTCRASSRTIPTTDRACRHERPGGTPGILERQAEKRSEGSRRERSLTSFWRLDAGKSDKRQECFERLSKADSVAYGRTTR